MMAGGSRKSRRFGAHLFMDTPRPRRAQALALRVIADRLEHGQPLPRELDELFEAA
jgi:hypothetical protein